MHMKNRMISFIGTTIGQNSDFYKTMKVKVYVREFRKLEDRAMTSKADCALYCILAYTNLARDYIDLLLLWCRHLVVRH